MSTRVYLSSIGRPVPPEEAVVSAFDRGFLYGDSVYETLRTAGGVPVDLEAHLSRLTRSAAGIMLRVPFSDEDIVEAMRRTMADAGNEDSKVRVVVTRGGGAMALDTRRSEAPLLVVYVTPLELPSQEDVRRGLSAAVVDYRGHNRDMFAPALKTGNYLPSILALRSAIEQGAEEAILLNAEGDVAEAAASNLFAVIEGRLVTPHLATGLLPGITRERVLDLAARAGLDTEERRLSVAELRGASEVFLTSSIRGIMPVTRLDGRPVGLAAPGARRGEPGPVTARVRAAYEAFLAAIGRGGEPTPPRSGPGS